MLGGAVADTLTAIHAGVQLAGGRGNDTLNLLAAGGATVRMAAGDGSDRVGSFVQRAAVGAANTLKLGPGFDPAAVQLYRTAGAGLGPAIPARAQQHRRRPCVRPCDACGHADRSGKLALDRIEFDDGTAIGWQQVVDGLVVLPDIPAATSGADNVTLSTLADTYDALGGTTPSWVEQAATSFSAISTTIFCWVRTGTTPSKGAAETINSMAERVTMSCAAATA